MKLILQISFSLLLFSSTLFGQKRGLNHGTCSSKEYYEIIPFEMMNHKIIIEVKIQGKNYRFLLDTGAPNVISQSLLAQLDYTKMKKMKISDANNHRSKLNVVLVKKLQIGSLIFENTPTLVMDLKDRMIFNCFNIQGIIGSNMLRNSILKIEQDSNRIILSDQIEKLNPSKIEGMEMLLNSAQSSPYIKVQLSGNGKSKSQSILFDTGMGDLFDLSIHQFNTYKKDSLLSNYQYGSGSSSVGFFEKNEIAEIVKTKIPQLKIGEKTLSNLITVTTESRNSRIGAKILKYADVILDYLHKEIYFLWKNDDLNMTEKQLELAPTVHDYKMIVGVIWSKELAKKIDLGDQIIRINDLILTKDNFCQLINKESQFSKNTSIELEIKKANGEIIILNLEKKDF